MSRKDQRRKNPTAEGLRDAKKELADKKRIKALRKKQRNKVVFEGLHWIHAQEGKRALKSKELLLIVVLDFQMMKALV